MAIDPGSSLQSGPRERPDSDKRAVMAAVLRAHDAIFPAREAAAEAASEMSTDTPDGSTSEPHALSFRAAGGGGLAFATAPKPAGELHLQIELGSQRWSVGLGGSTTLPVRDQVPTGAMETSMLLAEITPCARFDWARACGLVAAGALRTTGYRLDDSSSNAHPYAAGGGRFGAEIPLIDPVALRLTGRLTATLIRTRVLVGGEPIWRTPDLSVGLGSSLVFDFR